MSDSPSIVGIGASAGGLEALTLLFKSLPPKSGLAFVLLQHSDPKHESLLPELLGRTTQMRVTPAHDDLLLLPNEVYVVPPNASLTFVDGLGKVVPREVAAGPRMPIDRLLSSLAQSYKHRAIGVILSGTGSDGTLGLAAIKAEGGITFAQAEESAKYSGMPHSAIGSGAVDFVLPPEGIAGELVRIADHPYLRDVDEATTDVAPATEDTLRKLLMLLRATSGVDFLQYRQTTIKRRIFRRMALLQMSDLGDYLRYLEERPTEVQLLYEEMLPRVTRFFRDPQAFAMLQQRVFPRLLAQRPAGTAVRVWVPGCATGEEAYSIAISLAEFSDDRAMQVQIFGTDLSATAIERARLGWYPEGVGEDISTERQRFFVKRNPGYQVSKTIREMCVFAKHDVTSDPPFCRLDLISCRNVLIYLEEAQKSVISIFHYALKPGGFLMLGSQETATRYPDLFGVEDARHQIYVKKDVPLRLPERSWLSPKVHSAPNGGRGRRVESWDRADLTNAADRAVLSAYGPPGVIVNDELQVLQVRGKVSPFLEVAPGKMSASVLQMAKRAGLAFAVQTAIAQARTRGTEIHKPGVPLSDRDRQVNLHVTPLSLPPDRSHFLVLFEEVGATPRQDDSVEGEADAQHQDVSSSDVAALQRELAVTKAELLAVVEQQQQSTEEHLSGEEEALSSIEELQSVNEELETAKEELQSTNEELTTVNEELQTRNVDLQQSRDFASSIVETVRHPLLVLSADLRVQMANRAFYEMFQLRALETVGRFLYELSGGAWNIPAVRLLLGQVLTANEAFDDCEVKHDFPGLGCRVMMLNGRRLRQGEMILLAMEDITARRQAEHDLEQSEERLRHGQKLEAIGRLAGGVAHDFNNLLTVILGYSGLLLQSANDETVQQAEQIQQAAERAAAVTRQLLAFSRRQVLHSQPLNLNTIIADLDKMLRRLMGEQIQLVLTADPTLGSVEADSGQVGQIILNLSLNARDAMQTDGTLTIETANNDLDVATAESWGMRPGRYVRLVVRDTGIGMDPDVQAHVFEPFFTTKEVGQGTGLGLATVFGIVEQMGGKVRFSSQVGRGTTFEVYFPRLDEHHEKGRPRTSLISAMPRGSEVVLLVEDEDSVRTLTRQVLEQLGYSVLTACDGEEALTVCKTDRTTIDLLLTDVVMPRLGGRELAAQAAALRPALKILFMSGHTDDALLRHGVTKGANAFMQKPFSVQELACKVREVLDQEFREPPRGM